jgi:hypothetical protein
MRIRTIENSHIRKLDQIPNWYCRHIVEGAESRDLFHFVSKKELQELFDSQNRRCALTGEPLHFVSSKSKQKYQNASLDRIDNTEGYYLDNLQWVTKRINFLKRSLAQEELIELAFKITNFQMDKKLKSDQEKIQQIHDQAKKRKDSYKALLDSFALSISKNNLEVGLVLAEDKKIIFHFASYYSVWADETLTKREFLKLLKEQPWFMGGKLKRLGGKPVRTVVIDASQDETPQPFKDLYLRLKNSVERRCDDTSR